MNDKSLRKERSMSIRIKDIAKAANVSIATVSLVLNNKPGVGESTRQKILNIVKEMGYETNILSKPALKNNGDIRFIIYKKHGKVVADTPFFSQLMEGIDYECRREGYNLVISYINNDNKVELLNLLKDSRPQGIILLATEMQYKELGEFIELNLPFIVLDSFFKYKKLNMIGINNTEGVYESISYLYQLGHRKIGYLKSSIHINNFSQRFLGYINALKDKGIEKDESLVCCLEPTYEGAYRDMHKHLISKPNNLPTCFFADNDIIALGAIRAMKEYGLSIPNDISIIGFDDIPTSQMTDPSLTTVRVYKQRMGMIAVKRLIDIMNDSPQEYIKIEVGTRLIKRESCKRV